MTERETEREGDRQSQSRLGNAMICERATAPVAGINVCVPGAPSISMSSMSGVGLIPLPNGQSSLFPPPISPSLSHATHVVLMQIQLQVQVRLCYVTYRLLFLSLSISISLQSLSKRAPSWKIANNEKATTPIDWWPLINCARGRGEAEGDLVRSGSRSGRESVRTRDRLGSSAWRGNHLKIKSSVQL